MTGETQLSDQRIQQIVVDKALEVSKRIAEEGDKIKEEGLKIPKVNPEVNIYDPDEREILLFDDGIQVKGQKGNRVSDRRIEAIDVCESSKDNKTPRVNTDVIMLEKKGGGFEYITNGIAEEGNDLIGLEYVVKSRVIREYGEEKEPLNIVAITDGAKDIRLRLEAIFGIAIMIILDWYHLCKKVREHMSMIALNKEEKIKHLRILFYCLWRGMVEEVLRYLKMEVRARNKQKLLELITYIEKHKEEIIDYRRRKKAGKVIGSGRMEKGVDQVIGNRQKKKGMSWSRKGSKSLGILKVVELNGRWQKLWFSEESTNGSENNSSSSLLLAVNM